MIRLVRSLKPRLLIGLLATCGSQTLASSYYQQIRIDLDGDKRPEVVTIDARRGQTLSVHSPGRRPWRNVPRQWKPWKLLVADVDGDGRREIIVGVNKVTRYIRRPHNCLFVYGWRNGVGVPLWLGSSLSKPFTDFLCPDLDGNGRADLVALETRRDGRRCIVAYEYAGFGYNVLWQQGNWRQAKLLGAGHGTVTVTVWADGRKVVVKRTSK